MCALCEFPLAEGAMEIRRARDSQSVVQGKSVHAQAAADTVATGTGLNGMRGAK